MSALFDYLYWRGDLSFTQDPPNPVDALVFSALAYLHVEDIVPQESYGSVALPDVAQRLLALPDAAKRCRVKNDLELLRLAAQTDRFGSCRIAFYRNIFHQDLEVQFAAMTFLLPDGSAFLAFRGTDYTLTGWKEDFNMSFQDTVPAQTAALEYTLAFARTTTMPLHLCGHSKGGNLAVYAAAKCGPEIQRYIVGVHNNDGPGFREQMMTDPGYLAIVPRVYTYVPQSSVFGVMLEHEEPFLVVKSKNVGLMQHDLYNWEIKGGDFVRLEETTVDSQRFDKTLKMWLAGMSIEERNNFVDAVFDLLGSGGTDNARELIRPKNLRTVLKNLGADEATKKLLAGEFASLIKAGITSRFARIEPEETEKLEAGGTEDVLRTGEGLL